MIIFIHEIIKKEKKKKREIRKKKDDKNMVSGVKYSSMLSR